MSNIKNIFIVYPKEFLCYEKLRRKIAYLTSNSNNIELIFSEDENEYAKKYAVENELAWNQYSSTEEAINRSTHAIIFEDRECFSILKQILLLKKIYFRVISLNLTLVANKDRGDKYDIYIGRGSLWGNPYQIGIDGDRNEVIRKFTYDFQRGFLKSSENFEANILALKGKIIACHCKPVACHGDVLAAHLNSIDDNK